VKENPADQIESLTRSTFTAYFKSPNAAAVAAAVQALAALRGIGPATASLIVSVADPERAVFFGDEVFRWLMWDEESKAGKGWGRKIGYTAKEYRVLAEKAGEVCERLGVRAADLEKVGWVLGRENRNVDGGAGAGAGAGVETTIVEKVKAKAEDEDIAEARREKAGKEKKEAKPSKKRKDTDSQSNRRSKRVK
jgi:hypothetical protein